MRLNVGIPTSSTQGPWGELADIVIDLVRQRVTHLIVQPARRHDRARLVPVDTVVTCDDRVTLSMSPSEIEPTTRSATVGIARRLNVPSPGLRPGVFGSVDGDRFENGAAWRFPPRRVSSNNRVNTTICSRRPSIAVVNSPINAPCSASLRS